MESLFQTNVAGNILEFKTVKDYDNDAHNYTLVIELQGTDSRIQTLTVSLNVNDIEQQVPKGIFRFPRIWS